MRTWLLWVALVVATAATTGEAGKNGAMLRGKEEEPDPLEIESTNQEMNDNKGDAGMEEHVDDVDVTELENLGDAGLEEQVGGSELENPDIDQAKSVEAKHRKENPIKTPNPPEKVSQQGATPTPAAENNNVTAAAGNRTRAVPELNVSTSPAAKESVSGPSENHTMPVPGPSDTSNTLPIVNANMTSSEHSSKDSPTKSKQGKTDSPSKAIVTATSKASGVQKTPAGSDKSKAAEIANSTSAKVATQDIVPDEQVAEGQAQDVSRASNSSTSDTGDVETNQTAADVQVSTGEKKGMSEPTVVKTKPPTPKGSKMKEEKSLTKTNPPKVTGEETSKEPSPLKGKVDTENGSPQEDDVAMNNIEEEELEDEEEKWLEEELAAEQDEWAREEPEAEKQDTEMKSKRSEDDDELQEEEPQFLNDEQAGDKNKVPDPYADLQDKEEKKRSRDYYDDDVKQAGGKAKMDGDAYDDVDDSTTRKSSSSYWESQNSSNPVVMLSLGVISCFLCGRFALSHANEGYKSLPSDEELFSPQQRGPGTRRVSSSDRGSRPNGVPLTPDVIRLG